MTQLAILTASERRRFDNPPVFNNDERRLHFNVTRDVHNHFNQERHFYNRENFKHKRSAALAEWRQLAA